MTKSNAERQRRYRQRSLKDPDGLQLIRLQVLISPPASDALDRLVKLTGLTKRRVVEKALLQMELERSALEMSDLRMFQEPDVTV